MKNISIIIAFLGVISLKTNAQRMEFTPFSGYTFASNCYISGGKARIGEGSTFGGILGLKVGYGKTFEFMYSRQITNVYAYSTYLKNDVNQPVTVNYYLFGVTNTFRTQNPQLNPFTGLRMGLVSINPRDFSIPSITRFALNLSTGFKFNLNEAIDFRTALNLSFPVVNGGTNLLWSPGYGTTVGVSGTIPLVQFNALIGLGFKF